jgi:hypothetical protein
MITPTTSIADHSIDERVLVLLDEEIAPLIAYNSALQRWASTFRFKAMFDVWAAFYQVPLDKRSRGLTAARFPVPRRPNGHQAIARTSATRSRNAHPAPHR